MTLLARRDFVATIVSLAGTALPFDVGGGDADRGDGAADRTGSTDLTGVVDRIVGEIAVILIERTDESLAEHLVSIDRVPASAREEGAVLALSLADGEIERLRHDVAATRRRRTAAEDRFDALADDAPP